MDEISVCAMKRPGCGSSNSHWRNRSGSRRIAIQSRYAAAGMIISRPMSRTEWIGRGADGGTAGGMKKKTLPPGAAKPNQKKMGEKAETFWNSNARNTHPVY